MLKAISVDAVRINLPINPEHYPALIKPFWWCVKKFHAEHGEKKKTDKGDWGHWCKLEIDGSSLYVGLKGCMGVRYMEYGFKGLPNLVAFNSATEMFKKYSFAHALAKGRVKNFELAIDYAGKHTSDVISHLKGVHSSTMVTNNAGDGTTQYSGSPNSKLQLAVYDKAVELDTKKVTPYAEKILRVELRFRNRYIPLGALLQQIKDEDPFQDIRIVDRSLAIAAFPNDPSWKLFLDMCDFAGTACALKVCGPSKKTYLARIKLLTEGHLSPQLKSFSKSIQRLSNACSFADMIVANT